MSRGHRPGSLALGVFACLVLAGAPQAQAQRAAAGPPDWPCVQRLIPELAWGTLWSGPSPEALEREWWEDEEVGRVVRFAAPRSTPEEQAVERVREFVTEASQGMNGSEAELEERLTLLFSGLFELTNRERRRAIDGIRGASRAQLARLDSVSAMIDELEEKRFAEDADEAEIERLSEALFWEQRTFQHRQQALPAMCDQPYLLEERLSRLVRVIMQGMP
ncbi:hypothetical protein HOP51_20505 [Halomonas sp. MCCC 1A11036]|uniref:Uncharacterized protein n=1 Tax=Billgrantia zhangzhouensis TaxID=2733481 RepID=A0ABS9AL80_9GAMM|nr:hypothetical protein [Halomonas zhangzhouensis]MCE8022471.1 hypothetical protein [Halomonas zhangzhouensis]